MALEDLKLLSRRGRIRFGLIVLALGALLVWASVHLLEAGPPRRIVLASGPEFSLYHRYAKRYKELLAAEGVTVEERMTHGATENMQLLLDRTSGVDIAFMHGGVATSGATSNVVMLASLYYEPFWLFYHGSVEWRNMLQLKGKRIAVGVPGSGTRTLVERLTKASGINEDNTALLALEDEQAFQALKAGEVEAAFFVGGPGTPAINKALRDSEIVTIGARRAEGFTRQFPFLNKLILPTGAIDLALNIPDHDVTLLGTKAMLVAHNDLHPALINLLLDTARGIHGEQGTFEEAGEFPGTAPVDLPVSPYAEQHRRFGPSLLYHYLPFWLAAAIERTIIIVVPLLFVLVPALRYVPQALRSRTRSRIIRWYGELALLERDMRTRRDTLPVAQWLQDLDRIETAVAETWVPTTFAGELYTLREHIDLVRREIAAKAATHGASPGHGSASG